jgi:hypothetical protein
MAFNVERTYLGWQLASGEGVTLDYSQEVSREHEYELPGGFDVRLEAG